MKALSSEHDMTTALMQDMHRMDPTRSVIVLVGSTCQIQWVAKIWERHEGERQMCQGASRGAEANGVGLDMI